MTDAELLIPMTEPTTETAKPRDEVVYIVHTYSGYEHKAKAALEGAGAPRSIKKKKSARCWCRSKRVQELGKGGARKVSSRKFFPGYIFVQMVLDGRHLARPLRIRRKITRLRRALDQPARSADIRSSRNRAADGGRVRCGPSPRLLFEVGEAIKSRRRTLPGLQRHRRGKSSRRRGRSAFLFRFSGPRDAGRARFCGR